MEQNEKFGTMLYCFSHMSSRQQKIVEERREEPFLQQLKQGTKEESKAEERGRKQTEAPKKNKKSPQVAKNFCRKVL